MTEPGFIASTIRLLPRDVEPAAEAAPHVAPAGAAPELPALRAPFLNIAEAVIQAPSAAGVVALAESADAALEAATSQSLIAFANIMEAHDPFTAGHSRRVGRLARLIGTSLGLSDAERDDLERAGLLHDIGKLGIPEAILNKPGPLTTEEFDRVKTHPRVGHRILRPVLALRGVLDGVLHHHENWDGSGYPLGLTGRETPLQARILRVVDAFDAMTSARPYRQALPVRVSLRTLDEGAGIHFDPDVVRALLEAIRRMRGPQREDVWATLGRMTITH